MARRIVEKLIKVKGKMGRRNNPGLLDNARLFSEVR
jgi:hypothetical protein